MEKQVKQCRRCKRVLPITEFHKSRNRKDGLQSECKECRCEIDKQARERRKKDKEFDKVTIISSTNNEKLIKVYTNPDLAKFTPRQLMEELKSRGFSWNYMLEPQRKIYFDKI